MSDETKQEVIEAEFIPAPEEQPKVVITPLEQTKKKRGWPKGKPRKTAFQRLDPKKQLFVMNALSGKSATEAVALSGYSTNSDVAMRVRAHTLMNNQNVQNALQEKLNEIFPELHTKVAERLNEILNMPIRESAHGKGVSISDFLSTARFLQDVYGWKAPTKHFRVNANVKHKRLLPSD
jgi:hypothetical protein